jgi:hypothetical protein
MSGEAKLRDRSKDFVEASLRVTLQASFSFKRSFWLGHSGVIEK